MSEEQNVLIDRTEPIETWAFVELFGHSQLAGRLSTRQMGSEVMFQVDVPKGETEFSHSRLLSPKAIFAINPTTEEWCRRFARRNTSYGLLPYIPAEPQAQARLAPPATVDHEGPDSDGPDYE